MSILALTETLGALIRAHEELLAIAGEKQQIIMANDVGSLNRLVQRESRLLKDIEKLEAERIGAVQAMFASRGLSGDGKSLRDLERLLTSAADKKDLSERRETLLDLMMELKRKNEHNQRLLEHSIRFVNYSLDLYTVDPTEGITYHKPELPSKGSHNRFLNTRA